MNQSILIKHYDMLIEEGNDPVNDSIELKAYMNKWDGEYFIEQLKLTGKEDVLEIGVGTGRIAKKIISECRTFTGIDISPKTIERAILHLPGTILICDDFLNYEFENKFDVIYSSLTFLHFSSKDKVISKIGRLMNDKGRAVISLTKDNSKRLVYNGRIINIYPNDLNDIVSILNNEKISILEKRELDNAIVLVISKMN